MVAPDLQGRGVGRRLLDLAESSAPPEATRLSVFTGAASASNLLMYKRAGYRLTGEPFVDGSGAVDPSVIRLAKRRTLTQRTRLGRFLGSWHAVADLGVGVTVFSLYFEQRFCRRGAAERRVRRPI